MADIIKRVDRNLPISKRYQVFTQADASTGDIILIATSLGQASNKVVINAEDELVIKLNVYQTIYPLRTQGQGFSDLGISNISASTRIKNYYATSITLLAGESLVLNKELPIQDIEVVNAAGNFSIFVQGGRITQSTIINPTLLFSLPLTTNGISQLPSSLTINGTTVDPVFRYEAKNATLSDWTATSGQDLTAGGSGGSVDNSTPFVNNDDKSVDCASSRYWTAGDNNFGDIGTEDFVFECVFKVGANYMMHHVALGTGGWLVGSATLLITDGSTTVNILNTGGTTSGDWRHHICFVDKSGSGLWYINGEPNATAYNVSAVGSLSHSVFPTRIGANSGGTQNFTEEIAYVSMWKQADWLDTHEQAAVAKERYQRLMGLWPSTAAGTSLYTDFTRATSATIDKVESDGSRRIYTVSSNWPRICSRKDTGGTTRYGYLSEPAVTNIIPQSIAFDNFAWSKFNATVNGNSIVSPDGTTNADTLVEDGTAASTHWIADAANLTLGESYVASVFAKKANRSWLRLYLLAVGDVYFDLDNGVVGTEDDGTGIIEDWGNGWYRCIITNTCWSGGSRNMAIHVAASNGNPTFDGLNQDSLYIWGAQLEVGTYATSLILSAGAPTTRNADILYFKGDDGNVADSQGTVECKIMAPNIDIAADAYCFSLSDGGSSSDMVGLYLDTTDVAEVESAASGGNAGLVTGSTALDDGDQHTLRVRYETDNLDKVLVDTVEEGTADTSVDIPDDIDRIHIGTDEAGANQLNGLVSDVKIYDIPTDGE